MEYTLKETAPAEPPAAPVMTFGTNGDKIRDLNEPVLFARNATVSLSAEDGATCYYTTTGDEFSTETWTEYTEPFSIDASATLRAVAYNGTVSETETVATLQKCGVSPTPTINGLDKFIGSQTVEIIPNTFPSIPVDMDEQPELFINYKINTGKWLLYTEPLVIDSSCTLYAIGYYGYNLGVAASPSVNRKFTRIETEQEVVPTSWVAEATVTYLENDEEVTSTQHENSLESIISAEWDGLLISFEASEEQEPTRDVHYTLVVDQENETAYLNITSDDTCTISIKKPNSVITAITLVSAESYDDELMRALIPTADSYSATTDTSNYYYRYTFSGTGVTSFSLDTSVIPTDQCIRIDGVGYMATTDRVPLYIDYVYNNGGFDLVFETEAGTTVYYTMVTGPEVTDETELADPVIPEEPAEEPVAAAFVEGADETQIWNYGDPAIHVEHSVRLKAIASHPDYAAGNLEELFLDERTMTGLQQAVDEPEETTETWYDLQGRRVKSPDRNGIYIKAGKTRGATKKRLQVL